MIAHTVYFQLQDSSDEACDHLVAECGKYLKEHDGVVYFGAGRIEPELARPVNDREFHVSLHVVFRDRATHDAYQVASEHTTFIEENRANWAGVRVFDSVIEGGPRG